MKNYSVQSNAVEKLLALGKAVANCDRLESLWRLANQSIFDLIPCRSTSIFLINKNGMLVRAWMTGLDEAEFPVEKYHEWQGVTGKIFSEATKPEDYALYNDFSERQSPERSDPEVQENVLAYEAALSRKLGRREKVSHLAAVPILIGATTVGVVRLVNRVNPNNNQDKLSLTGFSDHDMQLVIAVSNMAVSRAETIISRHQSRLQTDLIKRLRTKANQSVNALEEWRKSIFKGVAQSLVEPVYSPYAACFIHRYDDKNYELVRLATASDSKVINPHIVNGKQVQNAPIGEGVIGTVFLKRKKKYVADVSKSEDFLIPEWAVANGYISMLCHPIMNIDQTYCFGTISLFTRFQYKFKDHSFVKDLASTLSTIVDHIQDQERMRVIRTVADDSLSRTIHESDSLVKIYQEVVSEVPDLLGFDGCMVVTFKKMREPKIKEITAKDKGKWGGMIGKLVPETNHFFQKVLLTKEIEYAEDFPLSTDEDIGVLKEWSEAIWSMAIVPIRKYGEGEKEKQELYGALVLYNLPKPGQVFSRQRRGGNPTDPSILNLLRDGTFAKVIAAQLAVAIKKRRERLHLDRELKFKSTLGHIIEVITKGNDAQHRVDIKQNTNAIAEILKNELHAQLGYCVLFPKDRRTIQPFLDEKPFDFFNDGIGRKTISKGKAIRYNKGYENADWFPFESSDVQSCMVAPMFYGSEPIGQIALYRTEKATAEEGKRPFSDAEVEFLEAVAEQTAIVLQAQVFYNAALRLGEVRFDEMNDEKVCRTLAETTCDILNVPYSTVWLIPESDRQQEDLTFDETIQHNRKLILMASHGLQNKLPKVIEFAENDPCVSWATVHDSEKMLRDVEANPAEGKIFFEWITDISHEQRFSKPNKEWAVELQIVSMITIPILNGKSVFGVINAYSVRPYNFLDRETTLLGNLAISGGVAIKNIRLSKKYQKARLKYTEAATLVNPGQVALSFVHDAKHTMSNLNAMLSALTYYIPLNAKKEEAYLGVNESLAKHTSYLNKLLHSLIKIGRNRKPQLREHDLWEIVEEVFFMFQLRLDTYRIEYEWKRRKGKVLAECDEDQMQQVFVNLLGNAIDAIREDKSKGGKIEVNISIVEIEGQEYAQTIFKDNGKGIPEQDLLSVFDAFFSTKTEGSGFGLSICRRIIEENHQGRIWAESHNRQGATFYVQIPVKII